jgi:hypothetical protein
MKRRERRQTAGLPKPKGKRALRATLTPLAHSATRINRNGAQIVVSTGIAATARLVQLDP